MQGWAHGSALLIYSCMPISSLVLSQLLAALLHICALDYEHILFKVTFLLAFGGGGTFRFSELLACTKADKSGCALQMGDLELVVLNVKFRQTKTDQLEKGQETVLQRASVGYCPCMALQLYLAVRLLGVTMMVPL